MKFHRVDNNTTQTREIADQQERSGEIWGCGGYAFSYLPKVRAYYGSLPADAYGIEFETDVAPDFGTPPREACWTGPREGVRVEGDTVIIKVTITRRRHR